MLDVELDKLCTKHINITTVDGLKEHVKCLNIFQPKKNGGNMLKTWVWILIWLEYYSTVFTLPEVRILRDFVIQYFISFRIFLA